MPQKTEPCNSSGLLVCAGVAAAVTGAGVLFWHFYAKKKIHKKIKTDSDKYVTITEDVKDQQEGAPSNRSCCLEKGQPENRPTEGQPENRPTGQQESSPTEGCTEGQQESSPTEGQQESSPTEGQQESPPESTTNTEVVACSRGQYLAILRETIQAMESAIQILAYQEEKLRTQGMKEEDIMEKLTTVYGEEVEGAKVQSFKKNKTTEEEFNLAKDIYTDAQIMEHRTKIDKIEAALKGEKIMLTPEQLAQIPDHFTIDRLMQVFKELFEKLSEGHLETKEQVKLKVKKPLDDKISIEWCSRVNAEKDKEIKKDIFTKYQITEKILDVAMQKYMHEPKLQRTMIGLQKQYGMNK